jgi:hypothetical protein
MDSIQSAIIEHLEQTFTVYIPYPLQARMDLLPAVTRRTLLGELFQLAAQAGRERELLPNQGTVHLQRSLAGCEVKLELDVLQGRLTLVGLERSLH